MNKCSLIGKIKNTSKLNGVLKTGVIQIPPVTQEKTVTPTKSEQVVTPDTGFNGLSKVTVESIPSEYIVPTGEIKITQNGVQDVTQYASADVDVYVNTLTTKTITSNGTYIAKDDGYDGYSEVTVETSGADLNDYFNTTITENGSLFKNNELIIKCPPITVDSSTYNLSNAFANSSFDIEFTANSDMSNVTNASNIFANSKSNSITGLSTLNAVDIGNMFSGCNRLTEIEAINCEKCTDIANALLNCLYLLNFGGFINIGQAYLTTASANYSNYRVLLSTSNSITYDSLMNVINNLYDIASKGVQTQQLQLGSTNLAKLTAEEIAIATNKGWTVS